MEIFHALGHAYGLSRRAGSPALRQARMPAAITEPKQLCDLHIELKVKQPTHAPVPKA